ncbi:MAG: hypothetical protein ACXVB1_00110 [Pseudobdellovibrionaceae bacterium]
MSENTENMDTPKTKKVVMYEVLRGDERGLIEMIWMNNLRFAWNQISGQFSIHKTGNSRIVEVPEDWKD